MKTRNNRTERLQAKLVFWRRTAIALGASALSVATFGFRNAPEKKVIGVSGGDSYIYRVYDDGSIDYIQADNQNKSPKGIPGWQPIPIDHALIRQNR